MGSIIVKESNDLQKEKEKKIIFNNNSDSITCVDRLWNLWNNDILNKYDILLEKHILLNTKYEELKIKYNNLIIKKNN